MPLVAGNDRAVQIEAIRAVGRIGDVKAAAALQTLDPRSRDRSGGQAGSGERDGRTPCDGRRRRTSCRPPWSRRSSTCLTDSSPAIRAAALRAIAALDPENLRVLLSGLDPDPHWSVRAALATMLGTLTAEEALPRLTAMLKDDDQRVIPSVLNALTKLKAPNASRSCSSG